MPVIHPTSLAATLDNTAEAFFYHQSLSASTRGEIGAMIVNRQTRSGANAGYFLPFIAEINLPPRLFSGEQLHTSFARRHILLIEAARILKLLALEDQAISQSCQAAISRLQSMCYSKFCSTGECRTLSVAYMRFLASDGADSTRDLIQFFLSRLADHHDHKGKWKGFPFFYTLLTLTEIGDPLADQELQYSAPACKKQMARNSPADQYTERRQAILVNALARS